MIGIPPDSWYIKQSKEASKDLRYKAEYTLMELEECLWKHYGPPIGKYRIIYRLFEWSANKLIWRE